MDNALHDTLSVTKRLKGAGMNEPQAEAVAEAIHGSMRDATAHPGDQGGSVHHGVQVDLAHLRNDARHRRTSRRRTASGSGLILAGHPPIFRDF